jgi:signal transduction histidine kinase
MATRARDLVLGPVGGALLLWVIAVAEIALGGYSLRVAAITTAAIAPLAVRGRAPALPLLVVGLAAVVDGLTGAGWSELNSPVAVVLVVAFVCGSRASGWWAAGSGLVAIVLFVVADLVAGGRPEAQALALAVVVPWLAGRAVRAQRRRVAELRLLSERLAREPDTVAQLAVAEERERLAAEVDDAVGHAITTMVVQAGGAERSLTTDRARAADALGAIQQTGRTAVAQLQRTLRILRVQPEQPRPVAPPPAPPVRLRLTAGRRGYRALAAALAVAGATGGVLAPGVAAAACMLLATGLVARVAGRVLAMLGLLAAVLAVWLGAVAAGGADVYDLLYILAVLSVPWIAGRLLRAAHAQHTALAAAVDELRRRHSAQASLAVAAERARLARDLHDSVAHAVSVMVLQTGAAEMTLDHRADEARDALRAVQQTGRRALADLERLLELLRRPGVGREPAAVTLADLDALLDQVRTAGTEVRMRVHGHQGPVPPAIQASAYHVVQEGLTNAIKHAGGPAEVTLRYANDALDVEVTNIGAHSRPVRLPASGHGLAGLRERVALAGGQLEASPDPLGGFAVRARLPLAEEPR